MKSRLLSLIFAAAVVGSIAGLCRVGAAPVAAEPKAKLLKVTVVCGMHVATFKSPGPIPKPKTAMGGIEIEFPVINSDQPVRMHGLGSILVEPLE